MTARKRLRTDDDDDDGTFLEPSEKRPALTSPAPFTKDLELVPARPAITLEEAKKGTKDPVRVYADGVFDLFHGGHGRVLMQAKNSFPNVCLIVGVASDEKTHKLKGQTVMSEEERYECVRHCRYVDEVVPDCPWIITPEFLEKHQIDFVAHDDLPYGCGDAEDIYKQIKEMGKFVATQRTKGISTSDLVSRIVSNYDDYVRRSLAHGYTTKDLNMGFIKGNEVRMKEGLSRIKEKASESLHRWEEKSRDLITSFMGLFGRDGRISEFFHNTSQHVKNAITGSHREDDENHENNASGSSSHNSPTKNNNST